MFCDDNEAKLNILPQKQDGFRMIGEGKTMRMGSTGRYRAASSRTCPPASTRMRMSPTRSEVKTEPWDACSETSVGVGCESGVSCAPYAESTWTVFICSGARAKRCARRRGLAHVNLA